MTRFMKRIFIIVGMSSALLVFFMSVSFIPLLIEAFYYHNSTAAGWSIFMGSLIPIFSTISIFTLGTLKR